MKVRPVAALAVACSMLVPVSSDASPSATAVNLRLSDLGTGYAVKSHSSTTPAQQAALDHSPHGALIRRGELLGDDVRFDRRSFVGILEVVSRVASYVSLEAAHAAYLHVRGRAPASGFRVLAIGAIGDERVAYTETSKSGGLTVTVDIVIFRRGTYLVGQTSAGVHDTFTAAQVIRLAAIVDGRAASR